jgi:hypothetical protein
MSLKNLKYIASVAIVSFLLTYQLKAKDHKSQIQKKQIQEDLKKIEKTQIKNLEK